LFYFQNDIAALLCWEQSAGTVSHNYRLHYSLVANYIIAKLYMVERSL